MVFAFFFSKTLFSLKRVWGPQIPHKQQITAWSTWWIVRPQLHLRSRLLRPIRASYYLIRICFVPSGSCSAIFTRCRRCLASNFLRLCQTTSLLVFHYLPRLFLGNNNILGESNTLPLFISTYSNSVISSLPNLSNCHEKAMVVWRWQRPERMITHLWLIFCTPVFVWVFKLFHQVFALCFCVVVNSRKFK